MRVKIAISVRVNTLCANVSETQNPDKLKSGGIGKIEPCRNLLSTVCSMELIDFYGISQKVSISGTIFYTPKNTFAVFLQ